MIKKNQTDLKNTIAEIKTTLEGINSSLDDTKEWMSVLKDIVQTTQAEQNKKIFLNDNSLRNLWDNIKSTNIHNIGVPEVEERERGRELI